MILWPDTFTNFFHLRVGQAAVEVLEAAGFEVVIPRATLCCGRPLYDYGMLGLARRLLLDILRSLSREIEAGVPVVGLEPSCVAVFRDELPQLLPGDERARRLSRQTFTLAELLGRRDDLPSLHGRPALVQPHCHHRSVLGFDADRALLDRLGLEAEVLDAGCCGMAGSFGFEAEKHEVSMACAERVLLPRVRRSGPATLVLADGFSCRTQVLHGAGRGSLHLAEAIWLALHGRDDAARATRERRSARRAADPHTMGGGP